MAISLTYDDTYSRVRIDADSLGADADHATVERSTDQIRWTTVRGGAAVTVTAGAFDLPLDDYEFDTEATNYYRVRGVDDDAISYIASGNASFDANAGGVSTVSPVLPAGMQDGDLMVLHATIRNSGTGTVNTPTGWTLLLTNGNQSLFGRYYVSGDAAPTVSFTGGVANATIGGKIHGFRNADLATFVGVGQLNALAQDIPVPGLAMPVDGMLLLIATWRQNSWIARSPLAGFTEIGDSVSTLGDDASMGMDMVVQTTATDWAATTQTILSGLPAISRAIAYAFQPKAYITSQEDSIYVAVTATWLKSLARPFLNRTVQVIHRPDITVTRPARTGIFEIVDRSVPIAISTVRGSRRWTMYVRTTTADDAEAMNLLLASGDTLLVQAPSSCAIETGYVSVGDVATTRHPLRPQKRLYTMPLTEVAAPGPDVVGSLGTWQTVLNTYATWADVLAANLTWADLLELIGDPSEVIVP